KWCDFSFRKCECCRGETTLRASCRQDETRSARASRRVAAAAHHANKERRKQQGKGAGRDHGWLSRRGHVRQRSTCTRVDRRSQQRSRIALFHSDSRANGAGVLRWREPDAGTRSGIIRVLSRDRPAKNGTGQNGAARRDSKTGERRSDQRRAHPREKETDWPASN